MVGAEAIEALGREILEALKRRTGARGEGYVLWGLTPEELITSLEGLAKEVPALAPRLPLYAERIRDGGFTLLVLLVGQGEVYLVGTEAPLELLPRGTVRPTSPVPLRTTSRSIRTTCPHPGKARISSGK
jgi:hypothetical protein